MKKVLIVLFVFLVGGVVGQEERTQGEFNVWIANNGNGETVSISMELVGGGCWDADPDLPDLHETTFDYPGTTQDTTDDNFYLAWEACWSGRGFYIEHRFGLGKYKITARVNGDIKDYFWLDWRNDQLPEHFGDGLSGDDINIDFDVATGKFYWSLTNNEPINKASVTWGERAQWPTTTSKLIPYKPINFNVFEHFSSPVLIWNHSSQNDFVTNYEIFRAVGLKGTFSKIATVSSSTTSYTDYDFSVSGSIKLQYKVRAKNSTVVSEFTPTKTIYGGLYKELIDSKDYTFELAQNYPNPFNPTTNISFSIPNEELVSLKVYDVIGNEVAVIVDERKAAGAYNVSFNGENLTSGFYIYKLEAGNYQAIKKLILLR